MKHQYFNIIEGSH